MRAPELSCLILLAFSALACSEGPGDPLPVESPPARQTPAPVSAPEPGVRHWVRHPGDVVEIGGLLAELSEARPLTWRPLESQRDGRGLVRVPLPCTVLQAPLEVRSGSRTLPSRDTEAEVLTDGGFLLAGRTRRLHPQDLGGMSADTQGVVRTVKDMLLTQDGAHLEFELPWTAPRLVLRSRARCREEATGATVRILAAGEERARWTLEPGEWRVHESVVELPPGCARLRLEFEGQTEARLVAALQWLEVGPEGLNWLVVRQQDAEDLVTRIHPAPPAARQPLPILGEGEARVAAAVRVGGPAFLEVQGDGVRLEVSGQEFADFEAPALLPTASRGSVQDIKILAGSPALSLLQPQAALLPRLDARSALDPDEGDELLRRLLRRVHCGGDRREAFLLPCPAHVELRTELRPGDRLRYSAGIAEPAPGEAVRFRVVWTGPSGRSELLDTVEVSEAGEWLDREVAVRVEGEGVLRFETAGPGTARPAAIADPRRVRQSGTSPPWNLLLYVVDTLRADGLSSYGNPRPTSPVLDRLAADGWRFQRCYSVASWTKPTTATLLTGLYPQYHGVTRQTLALPSSVDTLAEVLSGAGWSTWAGVSNVQVAAEGQNFEQGFHRFLSMDDEGDLAGRSTSRYLNDRWFPWLQAHRDEPFFLYLHSIDPHSPYSPRAPFRGALGPGRSETGDESPEQTRLLYDEEILGQDLEFGRLLDLLDEQGLRERTVIAVVADHGEEFGEHGRIGHGQRMWEEVLHVPMILWVPEALRQAEGGLAERALVQTPVSQVDLLSTLLDLLKVPDLSVRQGRSLLPLIDRDRAMPGAGLAPGAAQQPLIYAHETEGLGCLIVGPWKLIWRAQGDRLEQRLFHLPDDPGERRDLAAEEPEALARMIQLRQRHEAGLERAGISRGVGEAVEYDPADTERLRALGYLDEDGE